MATDEEMTLDERYKYLRIKQKQYRKAQSRQEKKTLLDEMEQVTGLHRKYLIKQMKSKLQRGTRSQERKMSYGAEVDAALALIWEAQDYICAERLKPILVETAQRLAQFRELRLSPRLSEQLAQMSVATVRRHLPAAPTPRLRRPHLRAENAAQRRIPIGRIPWDIQEPGHLEVDLVHHCGDHLGGQYGYTLQLIDVATGWSARRAILGRSFLVIADALRAMFHGLPFLVFELHPDNGSEFLNDLLLRFLEQYYPELQLSRSRPAHPNDNRFVEQKNSSLVRAFLGDRRLDTVAQIRYLNQLYGLMQPYYNFIQPVMHQVAKVWVPAHDGRQGYTRREHDTPCTPFSRLCATGILEEAQTQQLRALQAEINPLALHRRIMSDLAHLFTYPSATPGCTENVFETLADPDFFPEAVTALGLRPVDIVDKPNPGLPTVPTGTTTTVASL